MKTTDHNSIDMLLRPVAEEMQQVRHRIQQVLCDPATPAGDFFSQLDVGGGKMLRPAMTLLSGRCFGPLEDTHIDLAAMMEMIHLASLLHDDVIDQAKTRRSRGSANVLWGNTQAILLGDFVLSKAFAMGASLRLTEATMILCRTAEMICTGEIQQNIRKGDWELNESEYLAIIEAKTASLFGACCQLGALASGAKSVILDQIHCYGVAMGMAFQISDDLLDILGNSSKEGKTLGTDLFNEKLTLPLIHWLGQGGEERRDLLGKWLLETDRTDFCQTIQGSGAAVYSRGRMEDFARSAVSALADVPESEAKKSLLSLVSYVLGRV